MWNNKVNTITLATSVEHHFTFEDIDPRLENALNRNLSTYKYMNNYPDQRS